MTEPAADRTVEYFLQTQQPDGSWVDSSSPMYAEDWAREHLARRRQKMPQWEQRIAWRATSVATGLLTDEPAAVPVPPPADRAAVPALTQTQRDMLRYALDLAEEQMLCVGDEFSEDDYAAVDSLRRLAAEPPAAEEAEPACTCGRTACESDLCDCDATPCPVDHAAAGARQDEAQR